MNGRYVRMNQICLDLEEVETIEWKKIADDEVISDRDMYSLRIHISLVKCLLDKCLKHNLKK